MKNPINKGAILAIILVSYVMIVLDTSIVITGLPSIQEDLGFSDTGLSWVSTIYTLMFGGFLLMGARAGDLWGRRRMLVFGLAIFALSSLMIGVAQSAIWLVVTRAVQGVGAAILAPATLAMLQVYFPPGPERVRAVSFYAAAAGVSASIGLVLGGVLAEWLSWRIGFLINVPIGIGLILAAWKYVPATDGQPGRLDLAGAFLSTLGMSALVLGIVRSGTHGWTEVTTLQLLLGGLALLGLFVFVESRTKSPIMPLHLFANTERLGAYLARLLFMGAAVGFFFFMSRFMQGALGYSPAEAGLAFLPAMIANFAVAMNLPRLIKRINGSTVLALSLLISVFGALWLAQASAESTYLLDLALPMLLIGMGQGGVMGPLTASGVTQVKPENAGAAAGVVNVAHQIGGALGLGLLVAMAAQVRPEADAVTLLVHQYTTALEGAAGLFTVALILVFLLIILPARRNRVLVMGEVS